MLKKSKTDNKILARQWEIDSIKEIRAERKTLHLTALSRKTVKYFYEQQPPINLST